ncbi:MAG: discoidin domain-containing protein [Bacteroidales bacterium]|nr:discoidin domain-containing protein [Bacteroidales bacterium]
MSKFLISGYALAAAVALSSLVSTSAQDVVKLGRGSYASSMPLSYGTTSDHAGDQSIKMLTRKIWLTERDNQPIPTNDWWTSILDAQWSGSLWSYPAMIEPAETGITIHWPSYWQSDGGQLTWNSAVEIQGENFKGAEAIADSWHDWDVEMIVPGTDASKQMKATLSHGTPFTWIELTNVNPVVAMQKPVDNWTNTTAEATFYNTEGSAISAPMGLAMSQTAFKIGDDAYGLYMPSGSILTYDSSKNKLTINQDGCSKRFLVVALLPGGDVKKLSEYEEYAYNVVRDTKVSWKYDPKKGTISTTWAVTAENLISGAKGGDVIQGFIPHAYKSAVSQPSTYMSETFLTPRGKMKMTTGTEWTFAYQFAGILPWYLEPKVDNTVANPYQPAIMDSLMDSYATNGVFGGDTYWGGKGLTQMALNMTFALQLGDTEKFEASKKKLKDTLINWLTYTPGETNYFFAYYPRWGGMLGEATSYDSDTFNDHHFHYGYYTLAAAMLCLVDDEFKAGYGDMLKLIAKDYANWDRTDTRFPFLRHMDPWAGHSYAGGLGDQGNQNGNGQESTSEAMQGWGGVYLLGVALGDDELRDAGIFGWSTEARATREYWFDVDGHTGCDKYGLGGNIDYTKYPYPYNSNITCKGIGWWTWFGGDPLFMHGIQWMPISPALDYLSWDTDFVAWAYNELMSGSVTGWPHDWWTTTVNSKDPTGTSEGIALNDWGNVTLSYMQRAYPDKAAEIFDQAWNQQLHIATSVSASHIAYYTLHSHRTYGEIDFTAHADIPTANIMTKGDKTYYVVYNPGAERDVNFYRDGVIVKTVKAPSKKLVAISDDPEATSINIETENGTKVLSTTTLTGTVLDQYGATYDDATITWSVSPAATASIDQNGKVTVASGATLGSKFTVTATSGTVTASLEMEVNEPSYLKSATITPASSFVEKGSEISIGIELLDQYGDPYDADVTWTINGVEYETPYIDGQTAGNYVIVATVEGETYTKTLFVSPVLPNLVEDYCTAYASTQTNAAINVLEEGTTSRWESVLDDAAYTGDINDQWIYVDLIRECQITSVEINWEAASASSYDIQIAPQGAATEDVQVFYNGVYTTVEAPVEWTTVASDGASGAGTVTTPVEGTARYVRIKCNKRATQYAYSIYEIKIHGLETDDVVEFYENLALNKTATCSSSTGNNAYLATDGNAGSRWGSQFIDDQWLYVDLGKDYNFDKVVVSWEAAKAKTYKIQVAKDGAAMATYTGKMTNAEGSTDETFEAVASSEWTDLATVSSNGDGAEEITTSVTGNGRYVRILTTECATVYGSSIYELEVWGVSRTIGGSATDVQGMEISASAETINEDETATFTATVYNLDGTTVNTAVVWTTDNGTITSDGVLTPEKYGSATVTATSVDGELTATKTITVNEVIKLASLTLDPEELSMIAGDQADFSMEGYNQFGGLYDLSGNMTATVKDANGNVSNGISVDVDNMIVTANTQGTYTVTFTIGKVSQDWTVKVVPIVDINLALGQEATAGSASGNAASNVTDGDLTTRWQAAPGGEQWIMVELDNTYAVNRVVTTWEAAYATSYHIEVSIDGENWSTLMSNTVAPTAGAGNGQELIATAPGAARYVKLIGDELVGDAVTYGMSIFEIEIYGTARFDDDDTTAPVFTSKNIGKSSETAVTAGAVATDASGYISYQLTLSPLSAVGAESYSTGCNALSGDAISLTISDIAAGSYVATITAIDPYGNSTSYSETVTISAQSIIGVNLALNRPVTGSDAQDATPISNTVDGDTSTGWEAYHITSGTACDYYLQVELDGVYNLTSVVIVSNNDAYPMNGTLQFSEDGENWTTTVSANRTAKGTSTHTLNNVVAKYVRYNITSKNMMYGIWIHEFEVYGDSRLLGIASVNGTDVALSGSWEATRFASIDDQSYTAYDFTNVVVPTAGISGLTVKNPNAIIYKAEDQKISGTGLNIVEMTADGAVAENLNFLQGYNFNAAVDIRATGTVSVGFPSFAGKGMILLPFAYSPADNHVISRFVSYSATQASFTTNTGDLAANTPAMLEVSSTQNQVRPKADTSSLTISATNTTVVATPELMIAGGALQGTYLNVDDTSNLTYNASKNAFTTDSKAVPSFSASLVTGDSNSRTIDATATAILGVLADLDPETPIDVFSIDGRMIRHNVPLREATRGLATGFYLVGGQKLLVK